MDVAEIKDRIYEFGEITLNEISKICCRINDEYILLKEYKLSLNYRVFEDEFYSKFIKYFEFLKEIGVIKKYYYITSDVFAEQMGVISYEPPNIIEKIVIEINEELFSPTYILIKDRINSFRPNYPCNKVLKCVVYRERRISGTKEFNNTIIFEDKHTINISELSFGIIEILYNSSLRLKGCDIVKLLPKELSKRDENDVRGAVGRINHPEKIKRKKELSPLKFPLIELSGHGQDGYTINPIYELIIKK